MGANNWWLPQRKPQVTRGAHVIRSPCMTSDDTNYCHAQPWNPPQYLLQVKVKHYQHYLYKTSIFAIYICIQTQRTKGNLVIVVVNVRNLNYLSVSPSILPIVAL